MVDKATGWLQSFFRMSTPTKAMTIRLPADVADWLESIRFISGVPKTRLIADAVRAYRTGNYERPASNPTQSDTKHGTRRSSSNASRK